MERVKIGLLVALLGMSLVGCELWQAAEADSANVYIEMNTQKQDEENAAQVSDAGILNVNSSEEKRENTQGETQQNSEYMGVSGEGVAAGEILEEVEEGKLGREYFEDALFIGDSRTAGLREYGMFDKADYFATPGLNIYSVGKTKVTIGDLQDITLEELLVKKDYGKVYLMLGINELGYNFEQTVERYREFVEGVQEKEPGAVLYLCANLHVTITRSENDAIFNNQNIDKMNEEICKLAEEKGLHYLNINELYDDENGNLNEEYASDDSHVLAKYYELWCEWLMENIRE